MPSETTTIEKRPKTVANLSKKVMHKSLDEKQLSSFLETKKNTKTRNDYKRHILQFLEVISKPLSDLDPTDLLRYKAHLEKGNTGNASIIQALSAIRAFLKSNTTKTPLDDGLISSLLKLPKQEKTRKTIILSDLELNKIIKNHNSLRDMAMFILIVGAGLKVSEIANLKTSDFYEGEGGWNLTVRHPINTRKDHIVPLPEDVHHFVSMHVSEHGLTLGEYDVYVFQSELGHYYENNQLTTKSVQNIIANMINKTDIGKTVTPTDLRNCFAFRALRSGITVSDLSIYMGHNSESFTKRYVKQIKSSNFYSLPKLPRLLSVEIVRPVKVDENTNSGGS